MFEAANDFLSKHGDVADQLIRQYLKLEKPLLLRAELVDLAEEFGDTEHGRLLQGSILHEVLRASQEAVVRQQQISFAVRWSVARWSYVEFGIGERVLREISAAQFLRAKERVLKGNGNNANEPQLEVDLQPFERGFPRLREIRSIGNGADYLNRYLSSRLFQEIDSGGQRLHQFLRLHQARGMPLMLNDRIGNLDVLRDAIRSADALLSRQPSGAVVL